MRKQQASEVLQATRQIATLTRLGFPLHEGLKRAPGPRWLGELAEDLEAGDDLVQAMGRRPRLFSNHYKTLVEAALDSRDPVKGLEQVSLWLERSLQVQMRVRSALIYPLTLLLLALLFACVFLLFLVPEMAVPVAEASGLGWLALLLQSRILLIVLLVFGVGVFALVLLPPLQRVIRLADQTLWARGLATLLSAGKPLSDSLDMLSPGIRSRALVTVFEDLKSSVKKGADVSECLSKEPQLHDLLRWCGTQSKKQDDLILTLFQTADALESELEMAWQGELTMAEPRLMLGVGLVIALVLLTAWLPVNWAGSGTWI